MRRFSIVYSVSSLLISSALIGSPVRAEEPSPTGISRQLLMKKTLPAIGQDAEARVIRVQFTSGYKTPLHTHEGQGPRYVLKGRLRVEDAGQTTVYGPGDVFWETGAPMTIENIGGGDAEMIIFEVAPGH
jgi:quercetin dioxygenase-like cupin family protein